VTAVAAVARWLRYAAMFALIVMMGVTALDIGMRLTINQLVLGSVEIVQLMLVTVVFLALPETFLRDEHITVDALDQVASPRALRIARICAALASLALVAAMAWRMVLPALDTLSIGDLTSDLQFSLFWYWLPMLVGGLVSVVALVVVALGHIGRRAGPP
jgi:TRAP-type C4-dicarboxylate transport system permease small subunit